MPVNDAAAQSTGKVRARQRVEVGGNAKGGQEEVERGKCGVGNNSGRFTVNDKMRVNI